MLEYTRAGGLIRQRFDDDAVVLDRVGGARLEATRAFLVKIDEVGARRDDLGTGRQIGTLHELHERARGRLGLIEQMNAGLRDFTQVVRRDISGHADRNARRTIEQQIG